jgi:hypothetical protein
MDAILRVLRDFQARSFDALGGTEKRKEWWVHKRQAHESGDQWYLIITVVNYLLFNMNVNLLVFTGQFDRVCKYVTID